jgi:hypothetical protein
MCNAHSASEAIHMATIRLETLRRASEIIGDDKILARMLGVNERLLAWLKSEGMSIPEGVFFMCVDIVVSDSTYAATPLPTSKRPGQRKPRPEPSGLDNAC